jgi:hypothetical protein
MISSYLVCLPLLWTLTGFLDFFLAGFLDFFLAGFLDFFLAGLRDFFLTGLRDFFLAGLRDFFLTGLRDFFLTGLRDFLPAATPNAVISCDLFILLRPLILRWVASFFNSFSVDIFI